jgi:hypothetical protein
MAFFKKKQEATATQPTVKIIKETKCTCNACGKVWNYGKKDMDEQKNAKLANASKGLLCCSGCWPALLIQDKKVIDLTKCPECGSRNIKTEEVSYEVVK